MRLKGTLMRSRQFTHNRRGQVKRFAFAGGEIEVTGTMRTGPRGGRYLDAVVTIRKGTRVQRGRTRLYSGTMSALAAGMNAQMFVTWSNGHTHNIGTMRLEEARS